MALDEEQKLLIAKLIPLRRSVVEQRARRAAKVREALAPAITRAAERAHAGLAELIAGLDELHSVNQSLIHASGEPVFIIVPDLSHLLQRLAKLSSRE